MDFAKKEGITVNSRILQAFQNRLCFCIYYSVDILIIYFYKLPDYILIAQTTE